MEQLLSFAARLETSELGDAEPAMHLVEQPLRRRKDAALPGLSQAEALLNAPDHAAGCFRVPKII
jgi:aspartyl/glutamyl-tRNA(Asn/Gln) amidotransferase C subunit